MSFGSKIARFPASSGDTRLLPLCRTLCGGRSPT